MQQESVSIVLGHKIGKEAIRRLTATGENDLKSGQHLSRKEKHQNRNYDLGPYLSTYT
jgi:hypothetical protein